MTKTKQWFWSLLPLTLVALLVIGWLNRYAVFDWYALRSYTPPAEVAALAANSGMSSEGERIFYAHAPHIANQAEFNAACTEDEKSIVLGCYTGFDFNTDTDIYVYNVERSELDGIQEVTAAHEMLHAAYQRLSNTERQKVDTMTAAAFEKLNNPRITKLVEGYHERDASAVPNELHSILGTEVATLDAGLETYYGRYFSDRQKVVTLSNTYESVFNANQNEIDRLHGELSLRKNEISQLESDLATQNDTLSEMKSQMDQYTAAANVTAYNVLVPEYNAKVEAYNTVVATYKDLVKQYNELINEYNKRAVYQETLVNSIDSKYMPIN